MFLFSKRQVKNIEIKIDDVYEIGIRNEIDDDCVSGIGTSSPGHVRLKPSLKDENKSRKFAKKIQKITTKVTRILIT